MASSQLENFRVSGGFEGLYITLNDIEIRFLVLWKLGVTRCSNQLGNKYNTPSVLGSHHVGEL